MGAVNTIFSQKAKFLQYFDRDPKHRGLVEQGGMNIEFFNRFRGPVEYQIKSEMVFFSEQVS